VVSEIDSVPLMAYYTGMCDQLASRPWGSMVGECCNSCPQTDDGNVGKGKMLQGAVVCCSPGPPPGERDDKARSPVRPLVVLVSMGTEK